MPRLAVAKYVGMKASHRIQSVYIVRLINFASLKFCGTFCILWLAFIPTYFATASLGTIYQTGSLVLAIILNATVTLCTLFVPKIYFLVFRKETDNFTQSETYVSQKRALNSLDQRSSKFPSLQLPPPSSNMNTSVSTNAPIPHCDTLELSKVTHGNKSQNGTSMDIVDPAGSHAQSKSVNKRFVHASTQTYNVM